MLSLLILFLEQIFMWSSWAHVVSLVEFDGNEHCVKTVEHVKASQASFLQSLS